MACGEKMGIRGDVSHTHTHTHKHTCGADLSSSVRKRASILAESTSARLLPASGSPSSSSAYIAVYSCVPSTLKYNTLASMAPTPAFRPATVPRELERRTQPASSCSRLLRTKHLQACRSTVEDLTQECALQPRRGSWRSSQASRQQQLRLPRPACARRSPRLASVGPCSARLAARPNAERHTGVQAWCKCTADVQGSTCGCC